jgi:hypothetical protein
MAVHARLRSRDIGMARLLNIAVAVTAIHAELTGMQRMAKRHGLDRRVADSGVLGRGVVVDASGHDADEHAQKDHDLKREAVGRLRKQEGHGPKKVKGEN